MKFHFVNDDVPKESRNTIYQACADRDIEFVEYSPLHYTFKPENKAAPGDLLFRPAVSYKSHLIEQHLYQSGVSTFYQHYDGIYKSGANFINLFALRLHKRLSLCGKARSGSFLKYQTI